MRRTLFTQRAAGLFLAVYALCCGNATLWEGVPFAHVRLENAAAAPFRHAAAWTATHILHLTGPAAVFHPSGYSDRANDWIAAALMLLVAAFVAALWTLAERKRILTPQDDGQAALWLRWLLRMTLAVSMLIYGIWKMAPLQIHTPHLAVLNEAVGNTSPMTLFWTTLGVSKGYTRITGLAELTAAVLLLCRRTALAGILLTSIVMSNVLLFDLFFDVPVKLYSAVALLMCAAAAAPDLHALRRFLWLHEPAVTTTTWAPWFASRRATRLLLWTETVLAVTVCVWKGDDNWNWYRVTQANLRDPSPLAGQWHVVAQSAPLPLTNGAAMTDLYLEPIGYLVTRGADGRLWGGSLYDHIPTGLSIQTGISSSQTFRVEQPDATHLRLSAPGSSLLLERVPLPDHYPLLDARPQLVNEYPVER